MTLWRGTEIDYIYKKKKRFSPGFLLSLIDSVDNVLILKTMMRIQIKEGIKVARFSKKYRLSTKLHIQDRIFYLLMDVVDETYKRKNQMGLNRCSIDLMWQIRFNIDLAGEFGGF